MRHPASGSCKVTCPSGIDCLAEISGGDLQAARSKVFLEVTGEWPGEEENLKEEKNGLRVLPPKVGEQWWDLNSGRAGR